jgi:hypothetical protein
MLQVQFGRWLCPPISYVLLAAPLAASAQSASTQCPLIEGGGAIMVHGYEVVFSAVGDSLGSALRGMAVVRAPADFRSQRPPAETAERWHSVRLRHPGRGANVGPLMVVHDEAINTIWLDDSLPVPLAANNNVLLVAVDARGAFTAVGQTRIDPRFPRPVTPCDDRTLKRYYEARDTLWARFQASAPIRSFVSP